MKIRVINGSKIQFPERCPICGSTNTTTIKTSYSRITGGGLWGIYISAKSATTAVNYPICWRHKIIVSLLPIALLILFISGLFFIVDYPLNIVKDIIDIDAEIILIVLIISYAAFILFLYKRYLPIQITESGDQFTTLFVRDIDYAKELIQINEGNIRDL